MICKVCSERRCLLLCAVLQNGWESLRGGRVWRINNWKVQIITNFWLTVLVFAFPPGHFTRNNLFEDLFLFSWWEEEQNDPEGGSSQSFLLLAGIQTQEHQPPGVLGLPGFWGPSCWWLLLTGINQPLRPLSLARVSGWSMCFLLLLPTRNGGAEGSTHGRGRNGHDECV